MGLKNLTFDPSLSEKELKRRSGGSLDKFVSSFRAMAAHGQFKLGPIDLKDPDLNRIHAIVAEIDGRRLFYESGDEQDPKGAMLSLDEVRKECREKQKGIWANPECEVIVQEIINALNVYSTAAEKLGARRGLTVGDSAEFKTFLVLTADMRIKIWQLVGILKKKLGDVIKPKNLPEEIWSQVQRKEL